MDKKEIQILLAYFHKNHLDISRRFLVELLPKSVQNDKLFVVVFSKTSFGIIRLTDTNIKSSVDLLYNTILDHVNSESQRSDYIVLSVDPNYLNSYEALKNISDNLNLNQIEQLFVYLVEKQLINEPRLLEISRKANFSIPLSPLMISSSNEIYILAKNKIKVKLTPLQKAVYFLFLNHISGIKFSDLYLYKSELYNYYSLLSPNLTREKIAQTVEKIIDQRENSISEICSKIRSRFKGVFDVTISTHYYIDGDRGKAKRILLNRDFIKTKSKNIFFKFF